MLQGTPYRSNAFSANNKHKLELSSLPTDFAIVTILLTQHVSCCEISVHNASAF